MEYLVTIQDDLVLLTQEGFTPDESSSSRVFALLLVQERAVEQILLQA